MVKLPKFWDEYWLEFRYENLPIFCFQCGLIGHPFERCASFLELIDNGIDPNLPYGPQMIGDKLPNSGYDRYRTDFSKANVYSFLTRITKKAIGHAIPDLNSNCYLAIGSLPHPSPLTLAESSSNTTIVSRPVETIPKIPSPFPTYY
uniref:Zinc knuckle CX2CX4HX4C domain-containing protein n=1 Tax=Cannabis sativa TaxID=3483 RepID=A0A803PTN7_CANSA